VARPLFRKTLLAMAITTSQPLLADTVNLTGSQATLYSDDYWGPLIITGQASGEGYAVDLNSSFFSFFPGIVNQATLSASGEEAKTLALNGSGIPHPFFGMDVIQGDLINQGQINANGENASGIFLGNAAIILSGDLNNSGDIASNGTNAAGIRLNNLGALLGGSLNNAGNISASGTGAAGISLTSIALILGNLNNNGSIRANGLGSKGIALSETVVAGDLQNSGSIEVSGASSAAISLENGSSAMAISNLESGLISASGDYSRGLSIDNGSLISEPTSLNNYGHINAEGMGSIGVYLDHPQNLSTLVNTGVIQATGENSRAIFLDNVPDSAPPSDTEYGIFTEGVIRADGIAIEAAATPATYNGPYSWANVLMYDGLIEGGQAAIKGDGNVLLDFFGGEIRGDLIGLERMHADGNALFNGQLIQSPLLRMSSLELGQPHTRLEGNLEVAGDSELDLNLHTQTDPRRAILEVTGNATFEFNDQIRLKPASEDFRGLPLREYVLVSAAQINDWGATYNAGLQVTSLSDLLQIQSYEVTDTQVTAVVKGMSSAQVGEYLSEHGAQPHLLPAFTAFYGNTLGHLDDQDPLFDATIHSNDEELVRLAQQLVPEVNGAAGQTAASNHNLLGNVLQNRSASLRQGLSSGDGLSQTGAWVQLLDSDADQGERSGIPGYDADSQGIAVGADGKLNAQTTLGLAYSYLTSDVRSQSGNKTDIEGHALTLYSGFEQDAWFADASLTYGRSDNESKRYIAGTRAEGDYDSDLWGLNLLGGYGFDLGRGLLLEPRVAARYSNVQIDGFREKGSSAALAVGSQRYEVGEVGAGVRLAGHFGAGQGSLEPEAKLMAYHGFIADQASSTSAFVVGGTPFVTNGAKPARDSYEASVGLTYHLGAVSLGVSYDYLTKADYSADTVQAKVRYDF